jgi:SAM-dependent methyltransferase
MVPPNPATEDRDYTERLVKLQTKWWKVAFDGNALYRWNMDRLRPGFTLDIGCGIGRSLLLVHGNGVGVDHNPHSVEFCRSRGLTAFTPHEFAASRYHQPGTFDSLLIAHTLEHMTESQAVDLTRLYVRTLKPGGRVIVLTPQEKGYASDRTHVEFMSFERVGRILATCGLTLARTYSFPFPRWMGRLFIYNEFVTVGKMAG